MSYSRPSTSTSNEAPKDYEVLIVFLTEIFSCRVYYLQ